ncbi:MAG: tetratricopeptide repeat protein [Acidobacteria bacterium]|nr:tetratricopeptide repeat protein [Acidobacteriota bacterium]
MVQTPTSASQVVRFGVFEVDLQAAELRRNGVKIKLQEQPFQILSLLLERPGKVVTREEIQKKLWPADTFVDFEHSLNAAVKRLREALGDSADNPRFVETLPRRGYRFIYPVEGRPSTALGIKGQAGLDGRRIGRRAWLAALGLLALAALLGLDVGGLRDKLLGRPAPGEITSIAVLPLENLSGDPEQEYFVDGMTETLITELSKIGALTVISRQSVMQFKGTDKPLPEIARELNVDAVVVGSALHIGERVRITVQLIEAASDRNLWAENYDRDLSDVLTLHSEVARAIANEVKVALTPEEEVRLASARTVDPEAYQHYLKGNFQLSKSTEQGFRKALEHFQQALEIAPDYAPAHAGLSFAYQELGGWHSSLPREEVHLKAREAALKALELDDTLGEAYMALGGIQYIYEWDWAGAGRSFRQGVELNPSSAVTRIVYANYLTAMGRLEESIAIGKHTLEIDPLSPSAYGELGFTLQFAERYDEALEQYRKGLELDPNFPLIHGVLAWLYLETGSYEEAIAHSEKSLSLLGTRVAPGEISWSGYIYGQTGRRTEALILLDELKKRAKREYVSSAALADVYLGLGEMEQALSLLEKAYEEHDVFLVWLKNHRIYDSLRSDPRFQALLRRMNFPED